MISSCVIAEHSLGFVTCMCFRRLRKCRECLEQHDMLQENLYNKNI